MELILDFYLGHVFSGLAVFSKVFMYRQISMKPRYLFTYHQILMKLVFIYVSPDFDETRTYLKTLLISPLHWKTRLNLI